jgi:hypothetical protein
MRPSSKLTAIDISSEMVAMTRSRLPEHVRVEVCARVEKALS